VNIVIDVCTKGGDEGNGVSLEVGDAWEKTKEISFYVFFLRDPVFFSTVVNDGILVWVTVNSKSTGGGVEEVWEKVFYRYFWE